MVKKMRIISAALAAVLAAASLTGCGTSGNSTATSADTSKSESTDTSAASDEKDSKEVSLTVLCGYAGEDPHGKYVYSYADEFMKEHPNIKVEIQAISTNDIYTKLSAMATTPDDLPQIFFTSADAVATLHDLELTKDLTNLLPDDLTAEFANGVLDSCKLGMRSHISLLHCSLRLLFIGRTVLKRLAWKFLKHGMSLLSVQRHLQRIQMVMAKSISGALVW